MHKETVERFYVYISSIKNGRESINAHLNEFAQTAFDGR